MYMEFNIYKTLYCDVAVVGGGVAGTAAAIEAARHGKHTILFEKGTTLGGIATNGYVPQIAGNIEGICLMPDNFADYMTNLIIVILLSNRNMANCYLRIWYFLQVLAFFMIPLYFMWKWILIV